ncbi:MAG: hypothetical protein QOC61_2356 [Acidobacteriota bacterium]|nr:hypothetical protein [Acidobacteriota bacterium]
MLAEALKNINEGVRVEGAAGEDGVVSVRLRRESAGEVAVVEWRGVVQTDAEADPFRGLAGAAGLRLALAAKIIRAHGGEVASEGGVLRAHLPIQK